MQLPVDGAGRCSSAFGAMRPAGVLAKQLDTGPIVFHLENYS